MSFIYRMKASEKQRFSEVIRGRRNEKLAWCGSMWCLLFTFMLCDGCINLFLTRRNVQVKTKLEADSNKITEVNEQITFLSNFWTFCNFIWQPPLVHHVNLYRRNKKERSSILLSLQSKVESANNKILDQVCQLNQKFSQIETENSIVKQANSLLSKRLVGTERQC